MNSTNLDVRRKLSVVLAMALPASVMIAAPVEAQTPAQFYAGKTVNVYVGVAPGGIYSTFGTILVKHMRNHMPGKPNMIVQHMPGAGGSIAVNYVYTVAPKDGTALLTPISGVHLRVVLGIDKPTYDPAKFQWVGGWGEAVNTVTLRKDIAPIATLAEARQKEIVLGAIGKGSNTYMIPALIQNMLGAKIKIVTGYRGGTPIRLAIERGEVQGWCGQWEGWKIGKPDWVREGKLVHLVQLASKPSADLPGVPLLSSFAENAEQKRIFEIVQTGYADRAMALAPGVPADRVSAIGEAYQKTLRDPAFLADAKAAQFEIEPIAGETIQKYVAGISALPKETVAKMKTAMGVD